MREVDFPAHELCTDRHPPRARLQAARGGERSSPVLSGTQWGQEPASRLAELLCPRAGLTSSG